MGTGLIYLTISRICFAGSSFVIHIILARFLGVEQYGIYGVIMAFLNITYMTYQPGMHSAVTKFTAENYDLARPILKASLRIQFSLALIVALIIFLLRDWFSSLLKDTSLSPLLGLAAFIIIPTAINGIYQASLNGLKHFGKLSFSILMQAAVKIVIILLILIAGYGIEAIIYGLVLVAIIEMLISQFLCKTSESKGRFEFKKILTFASTVIVYVFCVSAITSIDLLLVKSIIAGNRETGLYTASVNLAKIPALLFVSVPTVILPSISRAIAHNDELSLRKYLNYSIRYMIIFLVPIAVILSASSGSILEFVYSPEYADAQMSLSILILGLSFSILLSLFSSIILGSGTPRIAMFVSLVMLPLDIILNIFLIGEFGISGAAMATSLTYLIGAVSMAVYIYNRFGTVISAKSFYTISIAGIILFFLTEAVSPSGYYLFIAYPLLVAVYFLMLFMRKEIGKDDIQVLREFIPNKRN